MEFKMLSRFTLAIYGMAAALTLALVVGCEESNPPSGPDNTGDEQRLLIVANQGAGTLSTVDILHNDAVTMDVAGVGIYPNDLLWDERLMVVNSGSHKLSIFDLSLNNDLTLLGEGDLGVLQNRSPQYGVIADDGFLYVSNFNLHDLTKFDVQTREAVAWIPAGKAPQDLIAIGDKVYVCNSGYDAESNSYDPGSVAVISTRNNQRIKTIAPLHYNAQYMALDRDGRIHVVCTGTYTDSLQGKVYVVDPSSDEVVQVIQLGGAPGEIAITESNMAYVAGGGWAGPGHVYRYDARTGDVLNGKFNPILVGTGAMRVVAVGDTVYVACLNADRVDRVIADSSAAHFTVGDGPGAMVYVDR